MSCKFSQVVHQSFVSSDKKSLTIYIMLDNADKFFEEKAYEALAFIFEDRLPKKEAKEGSRSLSCCCFCLLLSALVVVLGGTANTVL